MADEPIKAADQAPVPVVEQAAAVAVQEQAPVVVEQPVVEQAAVVAEQPVVEEKPAERVDLLKQATVEEKPAEGDKPTEPVEKPAEEKPAEKPAEQKPEEKTDEQKAADAAEAAKVAEPPPLAPVEYKYELPETIVMDDAQRGQFHEALDGFRADPEGGAQKLIDLHNEVLGNVVKAEGQRQIDSWNKTLDDWRITTMGDEQVGGAAWKTTETRGAQVRNMFVSRHKEGSPDWQADMDSFNHMLDSTGVGNHPALWRFLDNVAGRVLERRGTVVDPKPAPTQKRGGDALYTHDRSPGNGRA